MKHSKTRKGTATLLGKIKNHYQNTFAWKHPFCFWAVFTPRYTRQQKKRKKQKCWSWRIRVRVRFDASFKKGWADKLGRKNNKTIRSFSQKPNQPTTSLPFSVLTWENERKIALVKLGMPIPHWHTHTHTTHKAIRSIKYEKPSLPQWPQKGKKWNKEGVTPKNNGVFHLWKPIANRPSKSSKPFAGPFLRTIRKTHRPYDWKRETERVLAGRKRQKKEQRSKRAPRFDVVSSNDLLSFGWQWKLSENTHIHTQKKQNHP